jgi:beta-glucosidase
MKKVNEEKINELLEQLTLEEKIAMVHGEGLFQTGGVERLGIPPLKMSDGPMGVRMEFKKDWWINIGTTDDLVSYLPSNSALAATWNRELAYQTGCVLGAEARGRGKDVILAPGINIKRSPLCGRNFEYMSEDPKLIEELVVPLIEGIQENDVAACVKHFAANSQETERLWVDTLIDERTLREIYLPGFKAAVLKAETHTLMGAYNKLRGEHCCESKFLLGKILREEWGYDGAVISDWGGVHDTKRAAESELDIEMSVTSNFDDYYMAKPLQRVIEQGEIKEELLDKKIRNILRTMLRLNMLGDKKGDRKSGTYNTPQHREAVLAAARESVILLKNEENRLPIGKRGLRRLAVIGANGDAIHSNGGGSAEIKALYEISPLMGLKKALGGNIEVSFAKGYYIPSKEEEKELNWQQHSLEGFKELSESERVELLRKQREISEEIMREEERLHAEAIELAKSCDEVIFVGGLNHDYDVEGKDREDMILPYHQDRLIEKLLKVNPNTVIVMVAGSPVAMNTWAEQAKAIVWSWYAGMEGGTALAEVLLGEVNPSGKLPETIPCSLLDSPAHYFGEFGNKDSVTYKEGLNVGYRYFDTFGMEPLFCFGHGLSYTDFEYSNMKAVLTENNNTVSVEVEVTIKNIGDRAGAETIQLYVADKISSVVRPVHELKSFTKVFLQAGEEMNVILMLDQSAFGFYDTAKNSFKAEAGEYELQLGSSSRDIRLRDNITLAGTYYYQ